MWESSIKANVIKILIVLQEFDHSPNSLHSIWDPPSPTPHLEPNALVMTCSGRPAVRHLYNLKHTSPLWPFLLHALHCIPWCERVIFCTTLYFNTQYMIFNAFSGFFWNAANTDSFAVGAPQSTGKFKHISMDATVLCTVWWSYVNCSAFLDARKGVT